MNTHPSSVTHHLADTQFQLSVEHKWKVMTSNSYVPVSIMQQCHPLNVSDQEEKEDISTILLHVETRSIKRLAETKSAVLYYTSFKQGKKKSFTHIFLPKFTL